MSNVLSILFTKDGFSFCVFKDQVKTTQQHFVYESSSQHGVDTLIEEKIKDNLYWKQSYDKVCACVVNEQFNIIPLAYEQQLSAEEWLSFNTPIFEGDQVTGSSLDFYRARWFYSYAHEIERVLSNYFSVFSIKHAGEVFINSIENDTEEASFFVNLHADSLEVLCVKQDQLLLYNVFHTQTKEDVMYYILNAYKQLSMDTNRQPIYYFGEFTQKEGLLKMMLNFIRHVIPGANDIESLTYFTHYRNSLS